MDKTKQEWDEEWYQRTIRYLLLESIRNEAKEQMIQESLKDTGYQEYKQRYLQFLRDHSAATKNLNDGGSRST
jgi:hypothetical protein